MGKRCDVCLNDGLTWENAVPMCELTGDREEPTEFCPHCGVNCSPSFGKIQFNHRIMTAAMCSKMDPNSKFKVAGKGAFFSEEV